MTKNYSNETITFFTNISDWMNIIQNTNNTYTNEEINDAYTNLYNVSKSMVLNTAKNRYFSIDPELAEDAFQVSITKLFSLIVEGKFNTPYAIQSWLLKSCKFFALDYFKCKSASDLENIKSTNREIPTSHLGYTDNEEYIDILEAAVDTKNETPEIYHSNNEIRREINKVLKQAVLNVDQRKVIRMRVLEEKSLNEIAEELNMNLNTVKSNLRYAKMALDKYRNENEYDPREYLFG